MKKFLVSLALVSSQVFAEVEQMQPMGFKDKVMMHWNALSHMHKMLALGLLGLVAVLVVYKLLKHCKCKSGSSCGCK